MKLIAIELQEQGASCESCGHPIVWKYTVSLDTGSSIVVGSDCANSLLSPEDKDVLQKRANAAIREWRKQSPAPLAGETRQEYITRRIAEKSNAFTAWKFYLSYLRKLDRDGLLHMAAERQLNDRGLFRPSLSSHDKYGMNGRCQRGYVGDCSYCQERIANYEAFNQLVNEEKNAILSLVEQKFQANRADFAGMTAYNIVKI